jgi:hypothetical protein
MFWTLEIPFKRGFTVFAGDYNIKHKMWHSRVTNDRDRILYDYALQHNYEIIGPHTPTHFPANYNNRSDVLDIAADICGFMNT